MFQLLNNTKQKIIFAFEYRRLIRYDDEITYYHKQVLKEYIEEEKRVLNHIQNNMKYLDEYLSKIHTKNKDLSIYQDIFIDINPNKIDLSIKDNFNKEDLKSSTKLNQYKAIIEKKISIINRDISDIRDKIYLLEKNKEEVKRYFQLISTLIEKQYRPIRIVKNKKGDRYVLTEVVNNTSFVRIGLFDINNELSLINRLDATKKDNDCLHICDIWIDEKQRNYGNGSILLEEFLSMAKDMGYTQITGRLAGIDLEHFDLLNHFYKKHGFEVEFCSIGGEIKKIFPPTN